MKLETPRLVLEPVTSGHAEELWRLWSDPELHRFVPSDPLPLETVRLRCARWETRRSPDGKERWLNWLGRDKASSAVIAHFQAGIPERGPAAIAYMVARASQRKGYAAEGLAAMLDHLRDAQGVAEVKAWVDTRNVASQRLLAKLGLTKVASIANADHFKGDVSDEFVYAKRFRD